MDIYQNAAAKNYFSLKGPGSLIFRGLLMD
jgi:hypothetical protein